jgi:Tol biopolymer transport system component
MAWLLGAAAWVLWASAPEAPCGSGLHVARQQLGMPAGVATVDVSADGRVVAFESLAPLAEADVNVVDDVYVFDRTTGAITLASRTAVGGAADGSSRQPRLSGDGRFLVFSTIASNLVGSRIEGVGSQVLRQDRATGVTTLVSHTRAGAPGNGWSGHADISDDGRYVVFESQATDLVAGLDANRGGSDVYLFDANDGTIQRISVTDAGDQSAVGQSATPAISGNGRFVTFASTAAIDGPARARPDSPVRSVFVRDLGTGETRRISVARGGGVPNDASYYPAINGDGRRIVFVSAATDLDGDGLKRHQEHLYLHDADTGRLRLLTLGTSGGTAHGDSRHPALNGDGRFVVFSSEAANFRCPDRCGPLADHNLVSDVYRLDVVTGIADRISGGATAREAWWRPSSGAATDGTGHVVVFSSRQPIDEADLEDDDDLFVEVLPAGAGAGRTDARGPAPCTAQPAWPPGPTDTGQPVPPPATERRRDPSMP